MPKHTSAPKRKKKKTVRSQNTDSRPRQSWFAGHVYKRLSLHPSPCDPQAARLQAHRTEDIRCKGLKNVGHTCYINCIVQYIVNSPVTAFFLTGLVPEDPADAVNDPLHPLQVSASQRRELIRQLV